MMFVIPSLLVAGPYEDAQQFGQAGMSDLPSAIGNTAVDNQVVPGYQTSSPPEAQLNNATQLNNAALAGTANDPSGAGQFIQDSSGNSGQYTFSANDPLIVQSNQIQADAYSTMSTLNPSNVGNTTCIDVPVNTSGIVDTYTCNQSRPGSQITCSRDLSVSVNSNSSCTLGTSINKFVVNGITVNVLCSPIPRLTYSGALTTRYGNSYSYPPSSWFRTETTDFSGQINLVSSGTYNKGNDIIRWSSTDSSCGGASRPCSKYISSKVEVKYTNSCVGTSCSLKFEVVRLSAAFRSISYKSQHIVYSYTDSWTNQCQ